MIITILSYSTFCIFGFWGFCGGDISSRGLLGCDAMECVDG